MILIHDGAWYTRNAASRKSAGTTANPARHRTRRLAEAFVLGEQRARGRHRRSARRAASTANGESGRSVTVTPIASDTAQASTAATGTMGGSATPLAP
jgi:hypothetical protein